MKSRKNVVKSAKMPFSDKNFGLLRVSTALRMTTTEKKIYFPIFQYDAWKSSTFWRSKKSHAFIFTNNLNIVKAIETDSDCFNLQSDIVVRKISFLSIDKCSVTSISRKNRNVNYYYNINGTTICRCNEFVDLGVTTGTKLHLYLRDLKDQHFTTKLLFYSLVRSKLEYCCIV